ncbi:MAG: N-formylglutamate amidohydrolase [Promethearchaeota archaeon]
MILKRFFKIGKGKFPVILSCPHGGLKKLNSIPDKLDGDQIADQNTYGISKEIIKFLKNQKIKIYYLISKIHRSKIDFNRPPKSIESYNQCSSKARKIYFTYHNILLNFVQKSIFLHNRCLIIDLHGFSKPNKDYPDIILGSLYGRTLNIIIDSIENEGMKHWGSSQLTEELSKSFTIDTGLKLSDFNRDYVGGYITQQFYNKNNINAIQLEVANSVRTNLNLTTKFINAVGSSILKSLDSKTL